MKTIQTSSGKIKIEEVLQGVANLKLPDFDDFRAKIEQLAKKKRPPSILSKEKELIDKIKNGGPSAIWTDKYDQLSAKVVHGTITEQEHQNLLTMVPIAEKWSYERLKLLIELANLWEISLDDTCKHLDLKPRENIYV